MMKDRTRRIKTLKIEIEEIEKDINVAISSGRQAFAIRLKLIHERKENLLRQWILNS